LNEQLEEQSMFEETILGFDADLFISEVGLTLTAISAVIGIWIDRDEERPLSYSIWLTVLVVFATGVGVVQAYADYEDEERLKGDIARILQKVDKIAHEGKADVPALNETLKNEVSAQSRDNPDVIAAIAQRVADEGGDPKVIFGTYLTDADVQGLAAKGKLAAAPPNEQIAAIDGQTKGQTRHPATFGTGKAQLRSAEKKPQQSQPEKKP
jgi:hypothetical protein